MNKFFMNIEYYGIIIRPDYVFSYWILAWFLVYYSIHKKGKVDTIPSPKLAFYIAILENIVELILVYTENTNSWFVVKFLITIFMLKIIPIYLMRDVSISFPEDIYFLLAIFTIYVIYLHVLGTNVLEVYNEIYDSMKNNKNHTPFFKLIDNMFNSLSCTS